MATLVLNSDNFNIFSIGNFYIQVHVVIVVLLYLPVSAMQIEQTEREIMENSQDLQQSRGI